MTRACTASMASIIRQDILLDISQMFINTLEKTLVSTTDYITAYGIQLFKFFTLLKEYTFDIADDNITLLQSKGFRVNDILPTGFDIEANVTHVPPPLSKICINSNVFNEYFGSMLNSSHLQVIYSTYFGPRGIQETTLQKTPVHKAFVSHLPRQPESQPTLDVYVMQIALSVFIVNFQNMWSNTKRFTKLFNRLLNVLLKIHLAPIRERVYKQFIKNKMEGNIQKEEKDGKNQEFFGSIPFNRISIIRKSTNGKRRLFQAEKRRHDKYIKKVETDPGSRDKWNRRAERCQQRLNTYEQILEAEKRNRLVKPIEDETTNADEEETEAQIEALAEDNTIAAEELMEIDDECSSNDTDIIRRRLKSLVAVVRNLIFKHHGKQITERQIKSSCPDIKPNELHVCTLICNLIMPYVPQKKSWSLMPYQIPFVLMVNELLRITGYSKFSIKVSPLTMSGHLNALRMDAPAFFSLFCSAKDSRNLNVYDFEGNVIVSRQIATRNKDAIFSSFFNLAKIQGIAADHGLEFIYNMYLLPGLKTVRILGNLKSRPPSYSCSTIQQSSKTSKTPTSSVSRHDVKGHIRILRANIMGLDRQHKAAIRERKDFLLQSTMNGLKKA
ncbi:MAG: hypothetical protein EXX96DRAFT_546921 [Benjaminiella poitrasii]|nr:MAG: hypothetical protein EXX96DRAFT_546921 [Benjaminiella poitrasii]